MFNRLTDEILTPRAYRTEPSPPSRESPPMPLSMRMRDWIDQAEKLISAKPGPSLALAVGVGVLLGWLVKRK